MAILILWKTVEELISSWVGDVLPDLWGEHQTIISLSYHLKSFQNQQPTGFNDCKMIWPHSVQRKFCLRNFSPEYYRGRVQIPVFNKANLTGLEKVMEALNELE